MQSTFNHAVHDTDTVIADNIIMKVYNIYYNQKKINNKPLSKDDVTKIKEHSTIRKADHGKTEEIPVNQIRFIECTIF